MDRVSQSVPSTTKSRRRGRKGTAEGAPTTDLHIVAAGSFVAPAHYADRPLVAALVAEDACWQFTLAEWRSRRPSWYRFAERKVWAQEAVSLAEKSDRLREQARELGLPVGEARSGKSLRRG